MPRLLLPATLTFVLLVGVTDASAVTRYAQPSGGAVVGPCTDSVNRCELQTALDAGVDGVDDVELAPGTYTKGDGYVLNRTLTVRGKAGEARPLLEATNATKSALLISTLGSNGSGSTLGHLQFKSASGAYAVVGQGSVTGMTMKDLLIDTAGACVTLGVTLVEDSTFRTSAPNTSCASFSGPGTVRRLRVETTGGTTGLDLAGMVDSEDVTIAAGGRGGGVAGGTHRRWSVVAGMDGMIVGDGSTLTDSAVRATGQGIQNFAGTATLRNVTAVGDVGVIANGATLISYGRTTAINSIFRGSTPSKDVQATPGGGCIVPPCEPGGVALSYSNVRPATAPELVTFGAGMQQADPLFVSATDLHLQPTSPARNAGTATGIDSTLDIDRESRVSDGAIDIGADERAAPAPANPPSPPPVVPAGDKTAPKVSSVKTFKKGVISFSLSEAGKVTIKAERKLSGRRKGKKCVKPTRALRKAKKCTRYSSRGSTTLNLKAGTTKRTLKIKGKRLPAGAYRLTFTATDAAKNKSTRKVNVTIKK